MTTTNTGNAGWGVFKKPEEIQPSGTLKPVITNSTIRPTKTLALDFETYYGTNFNLRKLTTTLYVRALDNRAIHGMSYRTGRMKQAKWLRGAALRRFLESVDWDDTALLAHNAAFDGFILSQLYGVYPAYIYDTLSMARGLHSHDIGNDLSAVATFYGKGEKIAGTLAEAKGKYWDEFTPELKNKMTAYGINDTELLLEIFNEMLPKMPHDELDLIDLTIKAFTRPLLEVNQRLIKQELIAERKNKEQLLQRVAENSHLDTNQISMALSSNPQFAKLLEAYDVKIPLKQSPSNPENQIYAFAKNDIAFQNLGIHEDSRVRDLITARLAIKSTISESRSQRVILHSDPNLPIMLHYCKAHTFRWTGGDKINPQNFPTKRTDSRLRECLVAPKGYKLVVIDSSQIEDRMNAWVSGQEDVLEAYEIGKDNYKIMASKIYTCTFEDVNKAQRFVGKVSRLALGYQCGVDKFMYILRSGAMGPPLYEKDLSNQEISLAHQTYRKVNYRIVNNWNTMHSVIGALMHKKPRKIISNISGEVIAETQGSSILMPNGLHLHYPKIGIDKLTGDIKYQSGVHTRSKIYGGLLTENFVQSLARIVVGEQMLKIAARYPVAMMTHDEVVYLARTREAEKAYQFGLKCMTWRPHWCRSLPIAAEGGYGNNYGEIK